MKVFYVAGPFCAANAWEIEQNIRRAEVVSLALWRAGVAALCPHTNTRFFQGAAEDSVWLKGDLELLKRCDAVVLAPHWESSSGTLAEIGQALKNRLPVYPDVNEAIHALAGRTHRVILDHDLDIARANYALKAPPRKAVDIA